jgi:hypothetical protein
MSNTESNEFPPKIDSFDILIITFVLLHTCTSVYYTYM